MERFLLRDAHAKEKKSKAPEETNCKGSGIDYNRNHHKKIITIIITITIVITVKERIISMPKKRGWGKATTRQNLTKSSAD